MRYTDEKITELKENEIFVFGSNLAGIHGAGAAKTARKKFGAKYGVGIGKTGQTYAIPTMDSNIEPLPLLDIQKFINEFSKYAKKHKDYTFLVTKIGCGLGGKTIRQIAPLFKEVRKLENVVLPFEFAHDKEYYENF